MSAARSLLVLAAAAAMGGCMIPQPDTPPIGPSITMGAPNKATPVPTPENVAAPTSAGAPAADAAKRYATRLVGRIEGATASRITAVPENPDLPGVLVMPAEDGSFALELAGGGTYRLELTVGAATIVATPAVDLAEDGERRVVIKVAGDPPVATVSPAK